jgi:hypothetical protein
MVKSQPTAPAAQPDAPRAAVSNTPLQRPPWTVLRRIRAHQRNEREGERTNEARDMEPRLVGVRDQASGQTRIFTVYRSQSSVPSGAEPPPDPDPPPAAPARARPPADRRDSGEAGPGMWPHARAA